MNYSPATVNAYSHLSRTKLTGLRKRARLKAGDKRSTDISVRQRLAESKVHTTLQDKNALTPQKRRDTGSEVEEPCFLNGAPEKPLSQTSETG